MHAAPRPWLATALALALAVGAAEGQTLRLRGTIDSVEAGVLAFRFADGESARLVLAPETAVIAVVKATLADIQPGTYLGSAALPQPDGSQRALEVHLFPEAMRGAGEGPRPYAPVPQGTMTNGAAAGSAVTGVNGASITITYRGGTQTLVIPPGTPIVRFEAGSLRDLQPGARFVAAQATRRDDGRYEAARLNVGRDGVAPP